MRYNEKENIREHIMEMSNLVSKLTALKLELSEEILHFDFSSPQYNLFKINYNTQRKKWSLIELISHCVQEEERFVGPEAFHSSFDDD